MYDIPRVNLCKHITKSKSKPASCFQLVFVSYPPHLLSAHFAENLIPSTTPASPAAFFSFFPHPAHAFALKLHLWQNLYPCDTLTWHFSQLAEYAAYGFLAALLRSLDLPMPEEPLAEAEGFEL
jgi:hypothetical protein